MTHEVVVGLIVRSGRILLGRRSAEREFYPDVWDMFGGHMEPGEGHEQTLVRELEEELGMLSFIRPNMWLGGMSKRLSANWKRSWGSRLSSGASSRH